MRERVETWKAIAALLKRSERWCRYMAARAERPLPVFKLGGIVTLNLDQLQQWIDEEQADPGPPAHRDAVRAEEIRRALAAGAVVVP